jgi:hypothetical protein
VSGVQGRPKGARAELEVAALLAKWWGTYEPGTIFKRTPGSGGWGDKDARAEFRTSGDLVTSSASFPFCVEVKRREGWSRSTLLAGRKSPVWGWWAQAVRAAEEMSSTPLLVFRRSREPWSAMVPKVPFSMTMKVVVANDAWMPSLLRTNRVDYARVFPMMLPFAAMLDSDPATWAYLARLKR